MLFEIAIQEINNNENRSKQNYPKNQPTKNPVNKQRNKPNMEVLNVLLTFSLFYLSSKCFFSCGRTKIRTSPEDRNSFITVNNDTRNKDLVNFLDEISLQTLSYTEKVEEELEKKNLFMDSKL